MTHICSSGNPVGSTFKTYLALNHFVSPSPISSHLEYCNLTPSSLPAQACAHFQPFLHQPPRIFINNHHRSAQSPPILTASLTAKCNGFIVTDTVLCGLRTQSPWLPPLYPIPHSAQGHWSPPRPHPLPGIIFLQVSWALLSCFLQIPAQCLFVSQAFLVTLLGTAYFVFYCLTLLYCPYHHHCMCACLHTLMHTHTIYLLLVSHDYNVCSVKASTVLVFFSVYP